LDFHEILTNLIVSEKVTNEQTRLVTIGQNFMKIRIHSFGFGFWIW